MIRSPEQPGLSPFAQWSQACAERTSRRSNFAAGGFDTARQHMLGITGGRYDFSANRPSRFIDFGGANIRLGGTSIHYLKWNSETELPFFSDPPIAAQAERTFLLLLLKALPHDYLDRLNAPRSQIALYHVRRAEAFMREQGLHRHRPARGGGGRERADALLRIQAAPQRDADEISQAVAPDGATRCSPPASAAAGSATWPQAAAMPI